MYGVYQVKNLVNGKRYFGKFTEDPSRRWRAHVNGYDPESAIHLAIKKHGLESFEFKVVATFNSEDDAYDHEAIMIALFMTNIARCGKEFGYNLSDGGLGGRGFKHTDAAKQKIGADNMANPRRKKGTCELTKEQRDHLSCKLKGRKKPLRTAEHGQKIGDAHVVAADKRNPQRIVARENAAELSALNELGVSFRELGRRYQVPHGFICNVVRDYYGTHSRI